MTAGDAIHAAIDELVDALLVALRTQQKSPAPVDRLLSISEAAATLGIGRTALYSELTTGHLRSFKVGRRRLIPASAIDEYIARGEVGPDER